MEGVVFVLVVLAILCVVSGPIALVLSIIALNKLNQKNQVGQQRPESSPIAGDNYFVPAIDRLVAARQQRAGSSPVAAEPVLSLTNMGTQATEPVIESPPQPSGPALWPQLIAPSEPESTRKAESEFLRQFEPAVSRPSLEQTIGTRWVMIAGAISVFFAIGFFLKYAYDNAMIGPWGRIAIATASGIAALIVGEVTRRRDYQIVAKGVTALGFAILYAAVFSAYRVYDLIPATPAFALAIVITAGAMVYAAAQNEVLMAMLALLGGYLTPILLSTGQNLPVPLFIYVLILGLGAMGCAVYRKWPGVNLLCFFGTFGL
jgi:uncharacterized membrane protein